MALLSHTCPLGYLNILYQVYAQKTILILDKTVVLFLACVILSGFKGQVGLNHR